jgi:hypothetical protein
MKITELRELIEAENPCGCGYEWFQQTTKNWKPRTALDFFKKCKESNYNTPRGNEHYTPHGYLVWIFGNCLDWTDVCGSENGYWYNKVKDLDKRQKFLEKHFNVSIARDMTSDALCDALIRAFTEDE